MGTKSEDSNNDYRAGLKMEYNALRGEILQRIGLRQQIIAMTLTVAGAFLAVGVTTAGIALVYPPLAFFLAVGWSQNDYRVRDAATYIRENIESASPGLGWETYVNKRRSRTRRSSWRYIVLSHGGVFLITQLMAIGIGIAKFSSTPAEWFLLALDAIAIALVGWIVVESF
jgi:hypothetical protein